MEVTEYEREAGGFDRGRGGAGLTLTVATDSRTMSTGTADRVRVSILNV
jgi:hypothetical protein